jgi:kinesin family protein 2/24
MIRAFRDEHGLRPHPHVPPGDLKICICVRKRPINEKERRRKDYDAVTCFNPVVRVACLCVKERGRTEENRHDGWSDAPSFFLLSTPSTS